MSEKNEKKTASSKMTAFLNKNKKVLIAVLAAVIVILVAFILVEVCVASSQKKNVSKVEDISYVLTKDSASLSEDEIAERRNAALDSLKDFTKKSGIAGVRANMLAADLYYQVEDYENAVVCYNAAASKVKKAYTSPLNYFNAGVCYEQLGKTEEASKAYKSASNAKDQILSAHAKFNYARTLEALGNTDEAVKVYSELAETENVGEWANLAKSRVIALSK